MGENDSSQKMFPPEIWSQFSPMSSLSLKKWENFEEFMFRFTLQKELDVRSKQTLPMEVISTHTPNWESFRAIPSVYRKLLINENGF